jgi:hypothetical protein
MVTNTVGNLTITFGGKVLPTTRLAVTTPAP